MKAIVSMVGLLLVLAIVGLLARKQVAGPASLPAASQVTGDGAPNVSPASSGATPQNQVQQYKQSVDAALQQPTRDAPEDAK